MLHTFQLDQKAISAAQINSTLAWYQSLGRDSQALLQNTNISAAMLADSDSLFTYRQRITLIDNLLASGLTPSSWLAGRQTQIADYGILGYAMMSCGTLRQALAIAVKYHRMAGAMFDLQFFEQGENAIVRIDHVMFEGLARQYIVEELFVSIPSLISLLLGKTHRPKEIRLSYGAPDYCDDFPSAFGCAVSFDNRFCEYHFNSAELNEKLPKADPNYARITEQACRSIGNKMALEQGLVAQIGNILLSEPGHFPKLEPVAEQLLLSTRTMRRRLRELGTSYQIILDGVRKELASEYLASTNLSVQDVSELLGFSEVTNFRRAYLKWAGESPHRYRQRNS